MKQMKVCLVTLFLVGVIQALWSFFIVSAVVYAKNMQLMGTPEEQYKLAKTIIAEIDSAARTGVWFGIISVLCLFAAMRIWLKTTNEKSFSN